MPCQLKTCHACKQNSCEFSSLQYCRQIEDEHEMHEEEAWLRRHNELVAAFACALQNDSHWLLTL